MERIEQPVLDERLTFRVSGEPGATMALWARCQRWAVLQTAEATGYTVAVRRRDVLTLRQRAADLDCTVERT